MKKTIFALLLLAGFNHNSVAQGFTSPPLQWNIPAVLDTDEYQIADSFHTVIDMNGDGKPDLIDSENQGTESVSDVFFNGQQKYWKVYLNTNGGFSATSIQWNLPAVLDTDEYSVSASFHQVIDMNGDGLPDLVDTENHATEGPADVFFNGQQKYWKVYLNTGSGFSPTAMQWNIPAVLDTDEYRLSYTLHVVMDMNGDGKPDLVDSENEATNGGPDVFLNGQQKYWKVYLNNGSGFNATPVQWNIPAVLDTDEYQVSYTLHAVIDFNGDGKPDLIDSENEATNGGADVFLNGQQRYWKVYLNNGSGFNPTWLQWNIPATLDSDDYRVSYTLHTVIDMNGDLKPDLVDTENEATNSNADVFFNGQQKYWKVYLNNASNLSSALFEVKDQISVYPNPSSGKFQLAIDGSGGNYTLEIYNLQGQKVLQRSVNETQTIDLSNEANGFYFFRFSDGQSMITKKIIKQ